MENTNRNVFGLHGVTGLLIATGLLLAILAVLTYYAIKLQQEVAQKPYALNASELKMKSADNAKQVRVKE